MVIPTVLSINGNMDPVQDAEPADHWYSAQALGRGRVTASDQDG